MRISIVNNLALFIGMLQVNLTHNLTIDGKPFFLQQKATVMFLGNMSDIGKCLLIVYFWILIQLPSLRKNTLDCKYWTLPLVNHSLSNLVWNVLRSLYHNMYTEPIRYKSKRYSSIKTKCSTLGLIKLASTSSLKCFWSFTSFLGIMNVAQTWMSHNYRFYSVIFLSPLVWG